MARTNQGIFKEISNDFKDLEAEYEQAIEQYFPNGEWNCNYDFFSDFAYTADSIYSHANRLTNKISGMMSATKFELADKEEKYRNMLSSSRQIKDEIKSAFDDTLHLIELSGGGLSDIEQETLENLCIYSRR